MPLENGEVRRPGANPNCDLCKGSGTIEYKISNAAIEAAPCVKCFPEDEEAMLAHAAAESYRKSITTQ